MEEIWKDIVEFSGKYLVSNFGRIQNIKSGYVFSPTVTKDGYLRVSLWDKKIKSRLVHRLVAQTFLSNPDKLEEVNHKDGVKSNNHVDNLEWMTKLQNMQHAQVNGLLDCPKGESHYNSKLTSKSVYEIREKYFSGKYSCKKLGVEYSIETSVINDIVNNNIWKTVPMPILKEGVVIGKNKAKGETNPCAKWSEETIKELRKLHDSKSKSIADLYNDFNIPISTIRKIVNRKTWKHVA